MKKILLYLVPAILLSIAIYYYSSGNTETESTVLYAEAVQNNFLVEIVATGELKAKNSISVRGPQGMRTVGIYQTTVKDLVPEGTNVKKGDFVASLDKTELASKIIEIETEIEKLYTQLEQTKIDTAIQMKEVRDQMADLRFSIDQEKIEIEKNRYEPQMVIDQSKLKLTNSNRNLIQLNNKIELLIIQSVAKVKEIDTNIKQQQNKLDQLLGISNEFDIKAPEDGMVIYKKSWNGTKLGPGSQVSAWDPVVAELPDLTKMNSIAYINEVDISKIREGQLVNITVDAFPEKAFQGNIVSVSNIGQQLRNQEAKVFEITIEIEEQDNVLRPSMTTSNKINVYNYSDVVNIPLEGFYSDSIDFIVVKNGKQFIKREVVAGPSNFNNIIIIEGIKNGEQLCISPVENFNQLKFETLPLDVKQSGAKKLADWIREKEAYDISNEKEVKNKQSFNQEVGIGMINLD